MGGRRGGELDRRGFLKAGAGGAGLVVAGGALASSATGCAPTPTYAPPTNGTPFTLGVMAGFHSPTEVVLWTRLDPLAAPGATAVRWEVATDAAMATVVAAGTVGVGPVTDHTVKVLVGGLDPDRLYHYRFTVDGVATPSPVGRARTLPAPGATPTRLRLAFASCQNWTDGWYNAWAAMAAEDLDGLVWLGDYIYESSGTPVPGLDVRRDTVGVATTLDDYRAKYRLYRSDPLLQAAHLLHPTAVIWDDHEFRNDYNRVLVASDADRSRAAYRAWFEYMPVWPIDGTRIYRSLRWGRLAELFLLDTRQYRDPQAGWTTESPTSPFLGLGPLVAEAAAPGRTILGSAQRDWLFDGLGAAQDDGVTWKLIGNQVMLAPTRVVDLDEPALRALDPNLTVHDGVYLNLDSWNSYSWERDLLLDHLRRHPVTDVAVLTGDIHTFWQASLRADPDDPSSPLVANEYVSGSITSFGFNLAGGEIATALEQLPPRWSPPFNYVDFRRNGYGVLDCTPGSMEVSFRACSVDQPGSPTVTSARFTSAPGHPAVMVDRINP